MIYSEKLKELRRLNNMSQLELANVINIPRGLYSQYETEYTIIPLKHLNTLCNFFNVSLDYIFSFTKIKQYNNIAQDINKITCGKRIKEFRKKNKLTQVKLATILKTVHPVITNYENGKNLIATPFLYTICTKYNISADYLLGKINTPQVVKVEHQVEKAI